MKKLLVLTIGATLVWASAAFAAEPEAKKGPREFPGMEQRLEMMTKQLDLTTKQQAQVKALFQEEVKGMREGRSGASQMTPEERREKMMVSREVFEGKMKKILTADQWAKWEKQRRGTRGAPNLEKKGEGKRPDAPPAKKHKKQAE